MMICTVIALMIWAGATGTVIMATFLFSTL